MQLLVHAPCWRGGLGCSDKVAGLLCRARGALFLWASVYCRYPWTPLRARTFCHLEQAAGLRKEQNNMTNHGHGASLPAGCLHGRHHVYGVVHIVLILLKAGHLHQVAKCSGARRGCMCPVPDRVL